MRRICLLVAACLLFAGFPVLAGADYADTFDIAPVFTDNMVLQAGKEIVLYGTSPDEGKQLAVFLGEEKREAAVADGRWEARFPAREAGGEPFPVQVQGSSAAEHIFIENVTVGDVWIVMGQSNVEFNATALTEWDELSARLPGNIRVLTYTSLDLAGLPTGARARQWRQLNHLSAAQASALGVLFAEGLAVSTGFSTPIGLISAGFRGQDLAAFLPAHLTKKMDAVEEKGRIYESVIQHLEALPIAGLIWYQGEANGVLYKQYTEKFSAFIAGWREKAGHFPVYAVELSPCFAAPAGTDGASRQYMDFGTVRGVIGTLPLFVPDLTLCTTSDLFADKLYANSLHPPNKRAVASRVLGAVLARQYGIGTEEAVAPQIASISFGENPCEVVLTYSAPLAVTGGECLGFSGIDREWNPAEILALTVEDRQVRVTFDRDICIVRYGCHPEDVFGETLTLMGSGGIPAPNLWYKLAEPDKPSLLSFALLYFVTFIVRAWPFILLALAGAGLWLWRKKYRKQKKKEK